MLKLKKAPGKIILVPIGKFSHASIKAWVDEQKSGFLPPSKLMYKNDVFVPGKIFNLFLIGICYWHGIW